MTAIRACLEEVRRSLSIVIPAFNEEARVPGTVEHIASYLRAHRYDAEIIVVDDGSTDATSARLNHLGEAIPELSVLTHAKNTGKGFAVRAGILRARHDAVLFSDADLATPFGEIEKLWPRFDEGHDVVIASRRAVDSQIRVAQPWHRRVMGVTFSALVSVLGVRGISDTQCGFKLFRTEQARKLFEPLRSKGFAFDVEILRRARRLGFRVAEVGVVWANHPDSRIRPLRDSVDMLIEMLSARVRT